MILLSIFLFHNINTSIITILLISIIVFCFSVYYFHLNKINISCLLILISVSLLFGIHFLREKNQFYRISKTELPLNFYITTYGTIIDFPESKNDLTKIFLRTDKFEYMRKSIKKVLNIRVSIIGKTGRLTKGDRIRLNLKISRRNLSMNFFQNSVGNYFLTNKIHFSASCKSKQMITITDKNTFWKMIEKIRIGIKNILNKKYPDNSGSDNYKKAFIKAILLGDRGDVTVQLKEKLLDTGIYHVFAISGAHIGIISFFLIYLLKFIGIKRKTRFFITAFSIIFYLIISGGNVPAQRAVIIALIIIISKVIYQKADIYNVIAFSGIFILFLNPIDVLNPGFILTFTLSTGITAGRNLFIPLEKVPRFIKELISASLSASIISLPLSLYYFKRYSLLSFLSALLLIPLATMIIGLSFILFPLAAFPEFFSAGLLYILDPLISLFFLIIDLLLNSLDMTIYRASPHASLVIVFLSIFGFITLKNFKQIYIKKILSFSFVILIIFFISPDIKYIPENLEIYFLDVGQGDSEVVLFPDGKTLLIDGGGVYYSTFEVGKKIVLPFLLQKRIKIDWVAVSHTHPDHVRGIIEIINILKPSELWISQKAVKDNLYLDLLKTKNQKLKILYIDSRFKRIRKGYKIECIFPARVITEAYTKNNNSQVLKISNRNHSFLFTGDIEKKTERFLSETKHISLRSTVLKVPHHGSKTSSTQIFLNSIKPEIAVFSSKANNKFGFPHRSVLNNYQKIRSKMLFTAKSGGIKITSLKNSLLIEKSKKN